MWDTNIVFSEERKQITKRRQIADSEERKPIAEANALKVLDFGQARKGQLRIAPSFGRVRPKQKNVFTVVSFG